MQFLDTTFGDFRGSDMWNSKNPLREDCLYLHVWVPTPRREGRAVMVSGEGRGRGEGGGGGQGRPGQGRAGQGRAGQGRHGE